MRTFVLIISVILASVWLFVWFRLVQVAEPGAAVALPLAFIFLVSFVLQPSRWIFREFFHDKIRLQLWTYIMLGLMAHLFVATAAKDLLLLAASLARGFSPTLEEWRWASLATLAVAAIGNLWGVRTAWAGPQVREVTVKLPHWPEGAPPFRLAQISDLHVGPLIKKPFVENVVDKLNHLQPDAVAITGDLGDGFVHELTEDLAPLSSIRAKQGIFYVLGNHEYYWNANAWMDAGRKLGFQVLFNEGRELTLEKGKLWIGGVPDYTAGGILPGHESDPAKAMPKQESKIPKILLAHQPKSVFAAAKAGFDLMLSGHTHNGQFFPFNLLVGRFNPYSKGLNQHERMQVYVNVGTGFWGPPLRLGVPAEITLLTLQG